MKLPLLTLCLIVPIASAARAETGDGDGDGLRLSLGAAGVYRPEYKGSKDYEFKPLPFVGLRYGRGDYYVALEGASLRVNLTPGGFVEAGPVVAYERGRKDDVKNLVVRRLGKIDAAVNAGVFMRKSFDIGEGALSLGVEAFTDTGEVHKGKLARFAASYDRQLTDRWSLGLDASTTWADRKYMQTYYGVTARGAAASGLAPYVAGAGIETLQVGASLRYQISDRWSALTHGGYGRLVDSAADSPIVARQGSANQGQLVFALLYTF